MIRTVLASVLVVAISSVGVAAEQAKKPGGDANGGAVGSLFNKMAIQGNPSSLVGCAGGKFYNAHAIGASTARTRIIVDFQAQEGFDPIATAVVLQMGPGAPEETARVQFQFSDDNAGTLEPRLDFTLEYDANVVISVGSFGGGFGCYAMKVDVRVPAQ